MRHIGDRIREARESRGLSQSELARQVGVKYSSVQQWEAGATQPRPTRYPAICRALGISRAWLIGEDDQELTNVSLGPDIVKKIPVISWVQAGQWSEAIDMYQPGYAEEWQITGERVGPRAFMLRVEGDSMEPDYPAGLLLTIDPDIEALPGDFVVAKVNGHATFKQLTQDAGRLLLKALNPRYPTLEVTEGTTIAGVVVAYTGRMRRR